MSQENRIRPALRGSRGRAQVAALMILPLIQLGLPVVSPLGSIARADSKAPGKHAAADGSKEAPQPVDAVPDEEIPAGSALPGEMEEDMIAFGSHEHGVAEVQVIIEEGALVLDLRLPMVDGAGFERKPSDDKERKKFADALNTLKDPAPLFAIPASAGCKAEQIEVLEPEELSDAPAPQVPPGPPEDEASTGAPEEEHGDISAVYEFKCAKVDDIKSINVQLFKKFPTLKKITASYETPSGQGSVELMAPASQLQLK